ncbi:MAG TPA: glycogen debranching N-terminal domain-containing protein, partial [Thermoanaerobaculia bacterium]
MPLPRDVIRLRPRDDTYTISQGRTVLLAGRDGFLHGDRSEHGLIVHETRLLSLYRWSIDGRLPETVAASNVEQHSWLGYYIVRAPGAGSVRVDHGSGYVPPASAEALELRLSRSVGEGMHEDVELTNFSRYETRFTLALELDGDFADLGEMVGPRLQRGVRRVRWSRRPGPPTLRASYRAAHRYANESERGRATIERALSVRISHADSPPARRGRRLCFRVALPPRGRWHACLELVAEIDGAGLRLQYGCRSRGRAQSAYDRRRRAFLGGSTAFS